MIYKNYNQKIKENINIEIEEFETYRNLDGDAFDFGNGLIKNDMSFGSEDVYYKITINSLKELLYELENKHIKQKNKKPRVNRYKRKKITKYKLEKLYKKSWMQVYYSEKKQRYIKCYISNRKKYAKYCTNRKIRNGNSNNFKMLKSCSYRRVYDYWWNVY